MTTHRIGWLAMLVACLLSPTTGFAAQQPSKRAMLREQFKENAWLSGPQSVQGWSVGGPTADPNARPTVGQAAATPHEVLASPSARYTIYRTEYEVDVEEEIALVKNTVQLEVFSKGLTVIPLVNADVGLKAVRLNGKPSVVSRQGPRYVLLIERPGRYRLDVECFVRVSRERERGPGSFVFATLPSPIALLDVQMADPAMEIFVEPSIKTERETTATHALATVVLPYTEQVKIHWTKAAPKVQLPSTVLEPKLYGETSTLISLGEGVARLVSQVHYSILQSEAANLKLRLPLDVAILDVKGDDLRDWKVLTDEAAQTVDVYLSRGVRGPYRLGIIYEKTIGEGSVMTQLPAISLVGVERDQGVVGIEAMTNVEIAFNRLINVTPIDVKELPPELWSQATNPILLAYKYLKHPHGVEIEVTRHREIPVLVAAADTAHYTTLMTEEGKLLTSVTFQVRNNVKQFLRLTLPQGATLLSCFVLGQPVKPAQDADGKILIPLQKSESLGETVTQFPVEIIYLGQQPRIGLMGRLTLRLPSLDIPTSQLSWSVYLPQTFNYRYLGGDVKPIRQEMPIRLFAQGGTRQQIDQADQVAVQKMAQATQYEPSYSSSLPVSAGKLIQNRWALPIKMHMPAAGPANRFSKLLVTDESPWVLIGFVRNLSEAGSAANAAVLSLLLGVIAMLARGAGAAPGHLSISRKAAMTAAVTLILCYAWLAHLAAWLVAGALAALGAGVIFTRRRPPNGELPAGS